MEEDRTILQAQMRKLAETLERAHIADYVQLLHSPRRLIVMNLIAGTARGVGIAIGVTVFSATILYILKQLGALDLPIIGHYIADLVEAVQDQLDGRYFY